MVLNTVGSITGLSWRCMHDDVRGPRPRVAIYWHARAKRTLVRLRDRMSYGLQTQAHTISNPNKMHQCGHKHALKEKHHHFRCSICYFNLLDRANLQIRSHRIFEYWNGKVSFYFHQIHQINVRCTLGSVPNFRVIMLPNFRMRISMFDISKSNTMISGRGVCVSG